MRYRLLITTGVLALACTHAMLAQDAPTMQTCEYWFDYDFSQRQQVSLNGQGEFTRQFDLSALPRGVHSIGLRFADSEGRWCAPWIKHFVVPTLPAETYASNGMVAIEYWTDYDFEHRKTVPTITGQVALTLDFSQLSRGVHSLSYRTLDKRGIYTAPHVKHFVVPTLPQPVATAINAYEYWFNNGPRTRVEVDAQNPLVLENTIVEIKDVVPHAITSDYEFMAGECTVYVPDELTLGLQVFDDQGHPSVAVFSDAVPYRVPIDPRFTDLQKGEPTPFDMPRQGMKGFRAKASVGDSLVFSLNTNGRLDLYAADGQRMDATKTQNDDGTTTFKAVAATETVYALFWNAPIPLTSMQVTYDVTMPSGVQTITTDGQLSVRAGMGFLSVKTSEDCGISIFAASGASVIRAARGSHTFLLPAGVYVVRSGKEQCKVVVR